MVEAVLRWKVDTEGRQAWVEDGITESSHGMEVFWLKVFEQRDIKAMKLSSALAVPLTIAGYFIVFAIDYGICHDIGYIICYALASSMPLAITCLVLNHWERKWLLS